MQSFNPEIIRTTGRPDIVEEAQEYVVEMLENDYEFMWFEQELKNIMCIDIFDYPFDKDNGYTIISNENVELLLLKTEMMNKNEKIVGDFIGKRGLKYVNVNIGEDKNYKYIYEVLKHRICIPQNILDRQYQKKSKLNHFYTERELEKLRQKWGNYLYE